MNRIGGRKLDLPLAEDWYVCLFVCLVVYFTPLFQ
jgi:hypothetical protein